MGYVIDIPDLANTVARTTPSPKHPTLVKGLRRFEPLANLNLLTMRDGFSLVRRQVLTAAGDLVAEDHRQWLAQEAEKDQGRFRATAERLRPHGYILSQCIIEKLFLVADRGGDQDNFLQVEVEVRQERLDRRMFSLHGGWRRIDDLDDLVNEAEEGECLQDEHRGVIGRDHYELQRCIDVHAFMVEAEGLKTAQHAQERKRSILVTDIAPGAPSVTRRMTLDEINPDAKRWIWQPRRLFDDWSASSAGRGGHRLCDHWALQITDYTSPQGQRDISVIPLWTHARKMARIESAPNVHTLFGKLQSIDARRGAPFAWYFYMLHGNLVENWAGNRILKAAEDGLIVLPEHDYQILRRWAMLPYGF